MATLREEVTRAWEAVIVAGACATRAERMAKESAVLLASACGEADEAT
jgi:hypothetical protein